jgi:hypothetical protein
MDREEAYRHMIKAWQTVKLGEVLRRSEETIELQPDVPYRQITVKLWGKGVVLRGILTGAEIAAPRQMVARRGQFILSRIDARNGALGIVPPELDQAVVTSDFPLFDVIESRLSPSYLGWMCRTASFVDECRRASEGTTNRVRLQEDGFLNRGIPLPPLDEQNRRLENRAAKPITTRRRREDAGSDGESTFALIRVIRVIRFRSSTGANGENGGGSDLFSLFPLLAHVQRRFPSSLASLPSVKGPIRVDRCASVVEDQSKVQSHWNFRVGP